MRLQTSEATNNYQDSSLIRPGAPVGTTRNRAGLKSSVVGRRGQNGGDGGQCPPYAIRLNAMGRVGTAHRDVPTKPPSTTQEDGHRHLTKQVGGAHPTPRNLSICPRRPTTGHAIDQHGSARYEWPPRVSLFGAGGRDCSWQGRESPSGPLPPCQSAIPQCAMRLPEGPPGRGGIRHDVAALGRRADTGGADRPGPARRPR